MRARYAIAHVSPDEKVFVKRLDDIAACLLVAVTFGGIGYVSARQIMLASSIESDASLTCVYTQGKGMAIYKTETTK